MRLGSQKRDVVPLARPDPGQVQAEEPVGRWFDAASPCPQRRGQPVQRRGGICPERPQVHRVDLAGPLVPVYVLARDQALGVG